MFLVACFNKLCRREFLFRFISHETSERLDGRHVGSLTWFNNINIVLVFKLKVSGLYNAGVSCEHESSISLLLLSSLERRLSQYVAQTLDT